MKNVGVKKMEKTEKVAEKVVNSENVVLGAGKVEGKAENGQNGQQTVNANQKNMEVIAKLVMQKIESLNIDLSEISELNEIAKEVVKLNVEIQKLSEKRLQLMNRGKEIFAKLNDDAKRLLEFIGLINVEEIERAIGKMQRTQTQTTERTEKGNGLSGKKIVYNGKMYSIGQYFMQKHGIKGGLSGLEQWAKERGLSVKVEDDVIYII